MNEITDSEALGQIAMDAKAFHDVRYWAAERINDPVVLERLATEAVDEQVRRLAVKKIADPVVLSRLIKCASDVVVPLTAVENLNDPTVLAQVATEASDVKLAHFALEKINDPTVLAQVAKDAQHSSVRLYAVARITDPVVLAQVAKEESDPGVRKEAGRTLKSLADPVVLAQVAKEAKDDWVRSDAVAKIVDPLVLKQVVAREREFWIRERAAKKITERGVRDQISKEEKTFQEVRSKDVEQIADASLLNGLAIKAFDAEARRVAVEKLRDMEVLVRVATEDESPIVRRAALEIITRPYDLGQVALGGRGEETQLAAVARLDNPVVLGQVAAAKDSGSGERQKRVRLAAVERIADPGVLARVASKNTFLEVQMAAVGKIADRMALMQLAKEAGSPYVRLEALRKITDPSILKQLRKESNCADVQRALTEEKIVAKEGFRATLPETGDVLLSWTREHIGMISVTVGLALTLTLLSAHRLWGNNRVSLFHWAVFAAGAIMSAVAGAGALVLTSVQDVNWLSRVLWTSMMGFIIAALTAGRGSDEAPGFEWRVAVPGGTVWSGRATVAQVWEHINPGSRYRDHSMFKRTLGIAVGLCVVVLTSNLSLNTGTRGAEVFGVVLQCLLFCAWYLGLSSSNPDLQRIWGPAGWGVILYWPIAFAIGIPSFFLPDAAKQIVILLARPVIGTFAMALFFWPVISLIWMLWESVGTREES